MYSYIIFDDFKRILYIYIYKSGRYVHNIIRVCGYSITRDGIIGVYAVIVGGPRIGCRERGVRALGRIILLLSVAPVCLVVAFQPRAAATATRRCPAAAAVGGGGEGEPARERAFSVRLWPRPRLDISCSSSTC